MKRLNRISKILTQFDLSLEYAEVITSLLSRVGKMGLMIVTFGKDKSLIRARPMLPGEHRFNTKDDFSFKPQW